MNHIDNDRLLEWQLQLLDPLEAKEIESHLSECGDCRNRFEQLTGDIEQLSSVKLKVHTPSLPMPKPVWYHRAKMWRAAAILIIGFAGGYATSYSIHPSVIEVSPMYTQLVTTPDTLVRSTPCQPEELRVGVK